MILTALAVLVATALPATAAASSLLSGYGGPGQGSQAILGSTLLNGPRSGGGSSGSGGGEVTPAALSEPAGAASAAGGQGATTTPRSSQKGGSGGSRARSHSGGQSTEPAGAKAASPVYIVSRHADQPLLGISAGDLLAMIIAAGALVFVGGLTRRSAKSGARAPTPKGIGPNNRANG
jgi:hypothetical protein